MTAIGGPPGWRDHLGDARVLVSGFGKWGGGLYDLTTGVPEAIDDLATSGIVLGGGRLWRVLRAPGEQTSACELLSYDARGVRSYQRLDAVRDPHDVCWFEGAPHVSSSWDDAVWRVDPAGGDPVLAWQGSTVPDGWHVNSLLVVDGALHVCAFGRFDRHKAWKGDGRDGSGFVHDLRTGRDVLTDLAHPHTPRRRGDRWYVCESTRGSLTELGADGTVRRRARVKRFTRGLAFVGPFALVGGNAHREQDDDRGEIAVVDLHDFAVVERIALPCLEVYDIMAVGAGVVRGVRAGFGANVARAVDQHRAAGRTGDHRPVPPEAVVRLVTPQAAAALAAAGRQLDDEQARRCGLRGPLPRAVTAGEVTTWPVELVNRSDHLLATVPPRPVKIGARWYRLAGSAGDAFDPDDLPGPDEPHEPGDPGSADPGGTDDSDSDDTGGTGAAGTDSASRDAGGGQEPIANPMVPIPRVVPPGMRTVVHVPVEVPAEPGRYRVRVALRQPGLGWFGVRTEGEVRVLGARGGRTGQPAEGSATRPTNSGAPVSTWRTANR